MKTISSVEASLYMISIGFNGNTAFIDPFGAYVKEVYLGSKQLLMASPDGRQTHGGCAILAPFANRIRNGIYRFDEKTYEIPRNSGNNAIHGFLKDEPWTVVKTSPCSTTLENTFESPYFPSRLVSSVVYTVKENRFEAQYSATNEGDEPVPFMLGFHPYFLVGNHWKISGCPDALKMNCVDEFFPDGTSTITDLSYLSSNGAVLDSCFSCRGDLVVESDLNILRLSRDNMPYLQIYNGHYCQGISLAIEPMTAVPDCFNNGIGLITLHPGDRFKGGFTVTILG